MGERTHAARNVLSGSLGRRWRRGAGHMGYTQSPAGLVRICDVICEFICIMPMPVVGLYVL